MRTVIIFFSFIVYTFIGGALISPFIYTWIQNLAGDATTGLWGYLAQQPFGKISNRCFMIVAAIGIYPMLKAMHAFNKKDLGYDLPRKEFFKETGKGLSFGFLSLLVLAVSIVGLGIRPFEKDATVGIAFAAILKMIPGAVIIAFIEETFFRGIILNSMSRTLKPLTAIIISSFVFATIHFLRNKTDGNFSNPQWYTGFSYLMTTLQNYTDPKFLGSWLTLFTCGIFLSFLSLHYGNIARCIGVHCGWVIILTGVKKITDDDPDSSLFWMIGSYDKVTGYLAFSILSVICLVYWAVVYRKKKDEHIIEAAD